MSHGTPIEVSDKKMLQVQGEELKRLNGLVDVLRSRLQNEERGRYRAERIIGTIASSTIGDYDWCRRLCQALFKQPVSTPIEDILALANR